MGLGWSVNDWVLNPYETLFLVPADKVESMEECMLQDFDPDRHSSRGRAGRSAYDEDDDDEHGHGRGGRGGVQCESH